MEHIGKILQQKLKEPGSPSVKDFAELLGTSARTLHNLFNGNSDLTISQIVRASEILKHDFISDYLRANNKEFLMGEPKELYKKRKKEITLSLQVVGEADNMHEFPKLLNEINSAAVRLGFKIT